MDRLLREINAEKELIERTLLALEKALNRAEQTIIELTAMGTFIHNAYNGMENILKRILKFKKVSVPNSRSSHKDLLDHSVETGIISASLSDKLDAYRGFRHFFVHAYGFMLDPEQLMPLIEGFPALWGQFETEIDLFLAQTR